MAISLVGVAIAKTMCSTCPWREGSVMGYLRSDLEEASMKTARICHSSGKIIVKEATRASRKPLICRGSRNFQLQILHGIGFLSEPTDECWSKKQQQLARKKNPNHE